ncbi:MAG: cytochrome c [Paracoccaceae bacterium]|nr:cytochrome c [Paracoccaceae bacterium]
MRKLTLALVPLALTLLPGSLLAADKAMSIGQFEYLNSCAQCHGAAGKGDGPLAAALKAGAPDLTQLQKAKGGVFPVSRVYQIINGGVQVPGHGKPEMLAWGFRYRSEAPGALGPYYTPEDERADVEVRLLALVEYIAALQAK